MEPAPAGRKVLFAITKSNWGGAQSYVFDLALAGKERGYNVAVALGGEGLLKERLEGAGIRTLPLPNLTRDVAMLEDRHSLVNPRAIWNSLRQEVVVLRKLIALLKEERPGVLHLNSSKAGGLGALAGRFAKVPRIIFTAHGWPHKEPRPLPVKVVVWFLSWLTLWLSHAVIAVSENDVRLAPVFLSRKKVALVRNGIAPFDTLERGAARQALGLSPSRKVILSIAELHPNKDLMSAVAAFAELANAFTDWDVALIGEGEERAHLEAAIAHYGLGERIFLLGFRSDARTYLAAADVFLLPSRKEGLPITLLEAGLTGIPVVASRVGGIPEVVRHKHSGLLVSPHNPHALALALRTYMEHPEDAATYGENLKQSVTEKFSKERMLEETFATY